MVCIGCRTEGDAGDGTVVSEEESGPGRLKTWILLSLPCLWKVRKEYSAFVRPTPYSSRTPHPVHLCDLRDELALAVFDDC